MNQSDPCFKSAVLFFKGWIMAIKQQNKAIKRKNALIARLRSFDDLQCSPSEVARMIIDRKGEHYAAQLQNELDRML